MTNATLRGKPDAGNPHVRFDEGEVASAKPRRGSLLYKRILQFVCSSALGLALFGGVYADSLPTGMKRLEYIVSTGSQYIDTGIKLKSSSDVVHMRFMPREMGSGGVLFGNRVTASAKCFLAHYNSAMDFAVTIDNTTYENNRWLISDYFPQEDTKFTLVDKLLDFSASVTGITVKVDGVVCGPKTLASQDDFETVGTCTVLKGVAVAGGTLPNANGVRGALYSFSIVRDGTTILDLVPVMNGENVGMYDLVNGAFYGNAGDGAFTAGPVGRVEVVEVSPAEGTLSPGLGETNVADGATLDFVAMPGMNHVQQIRTFASFYTIEMCDWGETVYSAPVTNFGAKYTHVQSGAYRTRLTWYWAKEALMRIGKCGNGKVLVDGVLAEDCADRALPDGYRKLDYVESHGNSWIDTGVVLQSPSDRVLMKYTFDADGRGSGGVLFGSRVTAAQKCFLAHYNNYTNDFAVTVDDSDYNGNRWLAMLSSLSGLKGLTVEVDASIDAISVVCKSKNYSSKLKPKNRDTFSPMTTCRLFKGEKADVSGSSLPNENCAYGKMHRFAILRDGAPIMSLVPAVNPQGIAGFYDLVSKNFFASQGTEAFLPGPEVMEVWAGYPSPVLLTAKPRTRFLGWSGDVGAGDEQTNPLTVSDAVSKVVFATFAQPKGLIMSVK